MIRLYSLFITLAILTGACKKDHDDPPPPDPPKLTLSFSIPEDFVTGSVEITLQGDTLDTALPVGVSIGGIALQLNKDFGIIDKANVVIYQIPQLPVGPVEMIVENNGKKFTSSDFKVKSLAKWETKGNLTANRYGAVTFVIGNKAYIGTGTDYRTTLTDFNAVNYNLYYGLIMNPSKTGDFRKDWLEYDPSAGQWTSLPDFPGGLRYGAAGFAIGSKGYVGLGHYNNPNISEVTFYKDFWEFDPVAKTWSPLPDFPGAERTGAVSFALNNKAYVGLGFSREGGGTAFNDIWEFDPAAKAWTKLADFPGGSNVGGVGLSINNKGYILVGGTGQLWEFVPATNAWTRKADLAGRNRRGATAFAIGNKGYFGIGCYYGDVVRGMQQEYSARDFWEYDPATNAWIQMDYFDARESAFGFSVGNTGYIGGGISLRRTGNHRLNATLIPTLYSFIRK